MSAQPHEPAPARPAKNVLAIRAALTHPRDIQAFDAGLPVVVNQARAACDWRVLDDFVHTWWLMACSALDDPEGRRRMWETVEQHERGEELPRGRPLREVLGERAAELGVQL